MNGLWIAEYIARFLDYMADLGVAAVIAYALAFVPLILGPLSRDTDADRPTPGVTGIGGPATDR